MSSIYDFVNQIAPYPIEFFNFCNNSQKIQQTCCANFFINEDTPKLIKCILKNSGFNKVQNPQEANLIVGKNINSELFNSNNLSQRLNHYKNSLSLCSKIGFYNIMNELKNKLQENPPFYLETYLLPDQISELREKYIHHPVWIQKQLNGTSRKEIKFLYSWPEASAEKVFVQKCLHRPMLYDGRKFDMRFYVLISSLVPLRIYLFDNGFVNLAEDRFKGYIHGIDSRIFITNNKSQNQLDHETIWDNNMKLMFMHSQIINEVEDSIVMCIMASLEHFRQQNNHRLSFELFGFDVVLSINGDVYILEANSSPELDLNSELDNSIKVPLVKDMLNLALIPQPSEKVDFIEEKMHKRDDEDFCAAVCISEYEIAQRRCGRFRCIYPTVDRIERLEKYMSRKEREDLVLERWISCSSEEQAACISVLYEHFVQVLENANLKI